MEIDGQRHPSAGGGRSLDHRYAAFLELVSRYSRE
jgi:hypothetical protein